EMGAALAQPAPEAATPDQTPAPQPSVPKEAALNPLFWDPAILTGGAPTPAPDRAPPAGAPQPRHRPAAPRRPPPRAQAPGPAPASSQPGPTSPRKAGNLGGLGGFDPPGAPSPIGPNGGRQAGKSSDAPAPTPLPQPSPHGDNGGVPSPSRPPSG